MVAEPGNQSRPAHRRRTPHLLRVVLAILAPPVAVLLQERSAAHFVLSLVLTFILFYIPGIVHAVWLIAEEDRPASSNRREA